MSFISELKRRNVIRMAGLYMVGAWLIMQVSETLLPIFDTPAWVLKAMVYVLAIGFLPVLAFSWIFELTPEGLKRDSEVDRAQSIAPQTAHRMERMITILFAIALVFFVFDRFVLAPKRESQSVAAAVNKIENASNDKSIAVLPFVDMSQQQDQEYFSDGISEELLNRLAQIPDLRVAARTSAFQFKGKNLDVADIGRQLNVAHVLEGSVRKSGSRLRITAQLIKSSTGFHMWSQTFEGDAGDVFKVQDDIAVAITEVLKTKLSDQSSKSKPAVNANIQAFDSYLKGRAFIARRWLENLHKGIEAFDQAIALDPNYSAAYSGRAFAYSLLPAWESGNWSEALSKARASAEKALALDPNNAEAYMVRGMTSFYSYDAKSAGADLKRAHNLSPGSVDILNMEGDFQFSIANLRAAENNKRQAMALDPLSFVHPLNLADALIAQGRVEEAIVAINRSIALESEVYAYDRLVIANVNLKRLGAAKAAADKACAFDPKSIAHCELNRILILIAEGQKKQAETRIDNIAASVVNVSIAPETVDRTLIAYLYITVGNGSKAAQWLKSALDDHHWFPTNILSFGMIGASGAKFPEEMSQDPQWLEVWADPRLSGLMDAYRANLLNFRKGG